MKLMFHNAQKWRCILHGYGEVDWEDDSMYNMTYSGRSTYLHSTYVVLH